jgi:BNR repeat-like domain
MFAFKPTHVALALSGVFMTAAHAGVNVPVTQTCDTMRSATAYVAGLTGSTAILPSLVGNAGMTPCLIATDLGSSEPALAIRKDGTLIYAPVHFPNGDIGVMRSKDNGTTWDATVPLLANGKPHNRVQPAMFMEPETERLFFSTSRASFSTLTIKTGLDMSISDDGGDTWRPKAVDQFKGIDWVKYSTGPGKTSIAANFPKVMYLSGPTPISTWAVVVAPKIQQVLKSLDGGETWAESGGFDITLSSDKCPANEYILMGSTTVTPDGNLYMAGRRCKKVGFATSKDEGKTWTVVDLPNTKLITGSTTIGIAGNPNYVLTQPISSDEQGNLYVLYADDQDLLRLMTSRDKGITWSQPVVISAPQIAHVHLTSMAIKAPGQIAIAYYGTQDKQGTPTNHKAYVAESSNVFSLSPVFKSQQLNATGSPLFAKGFDANYVGMFAGGDLAELTQIQYAPNGDLFVSLVQDMCPGMLTCTWDFKAHNKSRLRALVGHITH